jgi:hypothetical protein
MQALSQRDDRACIMGAKRGRDTASLREFSAFIVVPRSRKWDEQQMAPTKAGRNYLQSSASPLRDLVRKRDFYAGGLMILFGLGIALKGATYRAGTLMHMGPGFLPTALGVILVLVGIAIAAVALAPTASHEDQRILPESPQWWAWLCILMSPVVFIFFGRYFGMAPGTFACVFIAALGDKNATWRGTFVLATVVTIFGVSLFSYFLQVPMPIFTWRGGL